MTDEATLWQQADEVLDRLLDLVEADRAYALQQMMLTPQLRTCVRALLRGHEAARQVSEVCPILAGAARSMAGRIVGRWRLEREIGRGGMSVVYAAHEIGGPTRRVAAVKVLTLGALAWRGVERFEEEQKILSHLNHPHIVPLFETGIAFDGTPWLAMALVEGEPIDTWCETRAVGVSEMVRLVLEVSEAVAYAHQNLVIHRDIKPSNISVDRHGHVRLFDFGIARLLEGRNENTLTHGQALTPEYAAPEQFVGAPASTAMDVFGLGALLYRLATGLSPRHQNGPMDVVPASRKVFENEHLPIEVRRERHRRLRGDLGVILMKALAPAPDARYSSVHALGEDLRRWSTGRPVHAVRWSIGYRFKRFVLRHRWSIAGAVTLMLSMAAGISVAAHQARRAEIASLMAQREVAYAQAVFDVLQSIFRGTDPFTYGAGPTDLRQLLSFAIDQARRHTTHQPRLRAELESLLGRAQVHQGYFREAEPVLQAAIEQWMTVPDATANERFGPRLSLAWMLLQAERAPEAGEAASRIIADLELTPNEADPALLSEAISIKVMAELRPGSVDPDAASQAERAVALARKGRLPDPVALGRRLMTLGLVRKGLGEALVAEDLFRQALVIFEAAGPSARSHARAAIGSLASIAGELGRSTEALKLHERSVSLARSLYWPLHPSLGGALHAYSVELWRQGFHERAWNALREAHAIFSVSKEKLTPSAIDVALSAAELAFLHDDVLEAKRLFEEVLVTLDRSNAGVSSPAQARALLGLSVVETAMGEGDSAARYNDKLEALLAHPSSHDVLPGQPVAAYLHLAERALVRGSGDTAEKWLGRARKQLTSDLDAAEWIDVLVLEARLLKMLHRLDEVELVVAEAITRALALANQNPVEAYGRSLRLIIYLRDKGRIAEAEGLAQAIDRERGSRKVPRRWLLAAEELRR